MNNYRHSSAFIPRATPLLVNSLPISKPMPRDAPSRICGKRLSRKYPLVAKFPIPSARSTEHREAVQLLLSPQIRKHDFLGARIVSFVIPKGGVIGTLFEPLSSQRFVRDRKAQIP